MISATEPTIDNIKQLFSVVDRELFTVNGKQSYQNTLLIFRKLADAVGQYESPDDDNSELWAIGEFGACSLDNLIVGAYWFCSECHSGQRSTEYSLLSSLGCVFQPGYSSGCEPDSCELDAYNALIAKHNEFNTTKLPGGWDN